MKTAAMGGRTGTHDTLWTWQQHEEAVQGPMAKMKKKRMRMRMKKKKKKK
ncbi:unnamed protein product [Staurois parvus]|uniref:Uncharacterized protein n=1 Tax=Staurois parvus TaxID=386267 RepID=A0ABN9GG74_9NEOB|nr:unnamed protein product [Staurois parvus]